MKLLNIFILFFFLFSPLAYSQSVAEIEKQKLTKRLEEEKQQAIESEKKHVIAWSISVGLLLAFGVLYKRYRDIQRHEKILEQQKNLIEERHYALEVANA